MTPIVVHTHVALCWSFLRETLSSKAGKAMKDAECKDDLIRATKLVPTIW